VIEPQPETEGVTMESTQGAAAASGVRWMRTVRLRNGRSPEAIQTIKGLAAFVEQHMGLKLTVFTDVSGGGGTVWVMADLPDMGAVERVLRGLMANKDYVSTLDTPAVRELFIDGTTQDSFLLNV
jgi:hypothetical protein